MTDWQQLHKKAYAAAEAQDFEKAEKLFEKAIDKARETGNKENLSASLNCLGVILQVEEREEEAERLFRETVSLRPESIDLPSALEALADLMIEREEPDSALALYQQAVTEARRLGTLEPYSSEQEKLISLLASLARVELLLERELTESELKHMRTHSNNGRDLLSLSSQSTAIETIEQLDQWIDKTQDSQDAKCISDSQKPVILSLGALWGEQLEERFQWDWVCFEGAGDAFALVSPNRSQMVTPLHFIRACLDEPELDCTILLAFNMLINQETDGEALPDRDYDNLMESVFRIVPKPGRTRSLADARLLV